jgi:hypothetical protein
LIFALKLDETVSFEVPVKNAKHGAGGRALPPEAYYLWDFIVVEVNDSN